MSLLNFAIKHNQRRVATLSKKPSLKAKSCAEIMFHKFNTRTISKNKLTVEITQQINCHNIVKVYVKITEQR
jgi:hypothetical protein